MKKSKAINFQSGKLIEGHVIENMKQFVDAITKNEINILMAKGIKEIIESGDVVFINPAGGYCGVEGNYLLQPDANYLKERMVKRLYEIKEEENGFVSKSVKWELFNHKDIPIQNIEFESIKNEDELLALFERVVKRVNLFLPIV